MSRCYGTLEYWEARYKFKEEQYEWYAPYSSVRHLLTPALLSPPDGVHTDKQRRTIEVRDRYGNLVPRSVVDLNRRPVTSGLPFPTRDQCRVLNVGCGNSCFGEDMMLDGWTGGIVNIDYSNIVVDQMNRRYDHNFYDKLNTSRSRSLSITPHPMVFRCADASKEIPYPDESFDLVVLKGTLDAVLCSSGSVANVRRMMRECCRVLRSQHGAMVVLTNGSPDNRLVFFENEGDEWWDGVGVHTIPRPLDKTQSMDAAKDYFVYISRKRSSAKERSIAGQVLVKKQLHGEASDAENSIPLHQGGVPLKSSKPSASMTHRHVSSSVVASVANRANSTTYLR